MMETQKVPASPTRDCIPSGHSGADLLRLALADAKTPEDRRLVEQAAGAAAYEMLAVVHRRLNTESGESASLGPFIVAHQHVIWELEALATGSRASLLEFWSLASCPADLYADELQGAHRRSAELVSRHLPTKRMVQHRDAC
jgi:hypothetical protein